MADNGLNLIAMRRNNFFNIAMAVAFIFLVPGFFIYHWFGNLGVIPMLLGGYSNESALLVVIWTLLCALPLLVDRTLGHLQLSSAELIYGVFMLYFCAVVMTHWTFGTEPQVSVSHTASIIQLAGAFVVFRFAPLDSVGLRRVLLVGVIWISLMVYQSSAASTLETLLVSTDNTKIATYQSLGRMFLLTVMAIVAFTQSRLTRLLQYLNATVVITLLGARSEVAGLFVFAAAFEWALMHHKAIALLFMTVMLAGTGPMLVAIYPLLNEWLPDNRVLGLLIGYEVDGSVQERGELNRFAIETINSNPLLGSYGSYFKLGGVGSYAHNILSAWVDTGVVGFGLMVALLALIAVTYARIQFKFSRLQPVALALYALGMGLLMQTIFLLVAAKSFTDVSLAVLVAVTGALRAQLISDGPQLHPYVGTAHEPTFTPIHR
jgi:hypothetical protein